MSEFKGTKGPWRAEKVHGWSGDLCITAPGESTPILKAIKPKRYFTDYPTRIDEDGEEWTVCSTSAAKQAGNYVATREIEEELDAVEAANMHLVAAAPDLLEALVMVRDADDDSGKDGLPRIPGAARSKIDRAIAKALNTDTKGEGHE